MRKNILSYRISDQSGDWFYYFTIIVPEWAFNAEFFDEKHETAKIQFKNYYADKNESLPQNMWQF